MTQITTMVRSLTQSQASWSVKSSGPQEASLKTKFGGGDGIPAELFQILKDDAVKVLHSICQQILKLQQQPEDWKRSLFITIPKRGNVKECSIYCTIALISHSGKKKKKKVKILREAATVYESRTSDVQAGFRKGRGNRDQMPASVGSQKKQEDFSKNICFTDNAKTFDCVNHNKLRKILKEMGILDHLTSILRNIYAGQEATVRT